MHCQHHQLPVSDSQKIVTFWFLCIFHISSLLRDLQAVLYVCRCKKFSPLCLCSNLSWLFAYSLLPSHFPCCAFIAPFWVQFFYKLLILCCQVYYFSESFCVWVHPTDNTSFIIYFPPCTFLLANAMFLVSVPHHFFLSAFSQLLSCFLPHRCFHMAVVPEVAYSVGDCAFGQIWASIGVCLNEF